MLSELDLASIVIGLNSEMLYNLQIKLFKYINIHIFK